MWKYYLHLSIIINRLWLENLAQAMTCVVTASEKLHCSLMAGNGISAKLNFHLISIVSKKWLVKWFPNHWLWCVGKVACEVSILHAATHQLPHMPQCQLHAITNAILNNNPSWAFESAHMGYLLLWGILSRMGPPITSGPPFTNMV